MPESVKKGTISEGIPLPIVPLNLFAPLPPPSVLVIGGSAVKTLK